MKTIYLHSWPSVSKGLASMDLIHSWQRLYLQRRRPWFDSWVGKIHWRRDRLPTPVLLGFPCGSAGKESTCNAGDLGLIPGLGRSPSEGKGYPLQYSGQENSIVHGIPKSWTGLSDLHFYFLSLSPVTKIPCWSSKIYCILN